MLEGVDYSHARPGGAHLASQGKRFAARYLYPGGQKGLTASEVHDLTSHGVEIPVVFEGAAGGMRQGHSKGVADAQLAQAQLETLPLDHGLPIYFAKDYGGGLGAQEIAYLTGAASVIGAHRVGLYGGWDAIDDAIRGHHAAWFWQTYAWSQGRVRSGIHLLQYANGQWGNTVDFCRALQPEYGQHAPHVPTTPPAHLTAHTTEEDLMPVYFKGDARPEVYYLNRAAGTKRHITAAEWAVAGQGQTIVTIAQHEADAIPAG